MNRGWIVWAGIGLAWSGIASFGGFAPQPLTSRGSAYAEEPESKPASAEPTPAQPTPSTPRRTDDDEFFELLRLFSDTLDEIDRNYVKEVSRRELMEAAIRGMLSKLDQHSNYIPPEEMEGFRGGLENEFGGIGIQVAIENGRLTVMSPLVGTPAYRAGIQAGDWISEIEGQSTRGLSIDDAIKKMKGRLGTDVRITVRRPSDDSTRQLTLQRETIKVDTVLGERRTSEDAWDYWLDSESQLGYIRVTSFGRQTAADVAKAVKQLTEQKMRGLILDLRFNPGGLLSAAIEISDLFIAEGKIVSTAGRNVPERVVRAEKAGTFEGFPIVVLVNRYSASASEIVAACLQDHQRAVVIGERSWGKGSVQNIVELEQGKSAIKLTTASYLRPSGKNIHRHEGAKDDDEWGVRPNEGFEIKLDADELSELIRDRRERDVVRPKGAEASKSEFVDRQLQRGVEYLKQRLAESGPNGGDGSP